MKHLTNKSLIITHMIVTNETPRLLILTVEFINHNVANP